MSLHSTSSDSGHLENRRRDISFWATCAVVVIALVLGFWGGWIYECEHHHHADGWSVGYHTIQFFLLHAPHMEHPVPWQLHAGRWLAALVVMAALVKGLARAFHAEFRMLCNRFGTGHVVIYGLGRLGLQLAAEYRRAGKRVVAIDSKGGQENLGRAHALGVAVIPGNACNPGDIARTRVERAEKVIAVCDSLQTNVAAAAAVGEVLARSHRPAKLDPLECWLFTPDARLRRHFQRDGVFPFTGPDYRVNVRGLELFEVAARQALATSPLDFERIENSEESTVVHLVIVGFGPMGRQLALQAARIGHFANFEKEKLRVTVVDREERKQRFRQFEDDYPKFKEICDFRWVGIPGETPDDWQLTEVALLEKGKKNLMTFALCWDSDSGKTHSESAMFQRLEQDDPANVALLLDLIAKPDGNRRYLVFQTRKCGLGSLFPVKGRGKAFGPQVHAFGMLEETCSLMTLMHEEQDKIAKVLHQDYYNNQIKEGNAHGSKPALFRWEELEDRFRDSNRQAADHIPVKLRTIGCRIEPEREDRPPLTSLDGDEEKLDLLAKMEHQRWSADQMLQGYAYGVERDDIKNLTHPSLVPWDDLDEGTQNWDRQQVLAIPGALKAVKQGIYPLT